MNTLFAALVGVVLAAVTAIGVASAMTDTSKRVPAGTSGETSKVVLYGNRTP